MQIVLLEDDNAKWPWLVANLPAFIAAGKVLIFVGNRAGCDELSANLGRVLTGGPGSIGAIHGERTQEARDDVIRKVRFAILVISCVT